MGTFRPPKPFTSSFLSSPLTTQSAEVGNYVEIINHKL